MIRLLFFEYEPRLIDDRLIRNIKKKMYFVKKRMEVAGCHSLSLSYPSKCSQRHGHNWVITVYCRAKELNPDGMVCDFTHIKECIHDYLDHGDFNDLLPFNPTAENIAKWVTDMIPECYKASVRESEGHVAVYVADEEPCGCVFEEDCPE